ncbi:hypothetical protein FOXB_00079 [Fusarium oxysporum f. sp. conglutinans Fo5176]|uniref:Rhodopsin domain-containing protein n=1 Tax=Fusarium oxysporum (strain Fo5176) TaxID=660025 RepID=F9F105_FUSOF|nr:hypothetical protein FOXB_00079 [Fusarium oxysporum f. sp. conglutinans Fo5176]
MAWNTSEKALELFIIQICCTILVYLSVCLRFWAQSVIMKEHVIYDKLMYISVFLYTAQVIIIVRGIVDGGIGQHADDISGVEIVKGFQTWYFGELIYAVLSCFTKTSVVLYLHRLYIGEPSKGAIVNKPILRISLIACLVCVWATSIVFFLTSIFQCSPVGYYWEQFKHPVRPGTCSKSIVTIAGIVLSVVLALSDWTLALVVPIMSLWKSWLPWQTKAAIHALTSLGVLAGAAMIVRIPYIKMLDLTEDFLYETVVERGTKQDTIQNNHDTTQNNRDTILIHTDFFLSESFANNSDNHVRYDPNDSFRNDQWRP